MKYVKLVKPGTNKSQVIETDKVDFYRQYGWEPAVQEVTAVLRPRKKTAKTEPAVEEVAEAAPSVEEVGNDEQQGDQL